MTNDLTVTFQAADYFERYYMKLKIENSFTKITRISRAAAKVAYQYYLEQGREVIWLGKWNGQAFEDTIIEISQVS